MAPCGLDPALRSNRNATKIIHARDKLIPLALHNGGTKGPVLVTEFSDEQHVILTRRGNIAFERLPAHAQRRGRRTCGGWVAALAVRSAEPWAYVAAWAARGGLGYVGSTLDSTHERERSTAAASVRPSSGRCQEKGTSARTMRVAVAVSGPRPPTQPAQRWFGNKWIGPRPMRAHPQKRQLKRRRSAPIRCLHRASGRFGAAPLGRGEAPTQSLQHAGAAATRRIVPSQRRSATAIGQGFGKR